MKRKIFYLIAGTYIFCNLSNAQTNLNFEGWSGNEPDGWVTSNYITEPNGGAQTVFKENTNPGQASNSVKMVTGSCPDCPNFSVFGTFGPATPLPNPYGGGIQLGSFVNPGAPYSQRPISIDFKYKSKPSGSDIGGFHLELTRWNSTKGETETVGEASFFSSTQVTNWTNVNIPVVYYSSSAPDTINIFATSSIGSIPDLSAFGVPKPPIPTPVSGSEFYLDAIVINLPSCDGFKISMSGTKETGIGLGDGTASVTTNGGAAPYTYQWSTLANTQTINSLIPGLYYVTATDANLCVKVGSYFVAPGGCSVTISVTGTKSNSNDVFQGTGSATVTAVGGNPPYEFLWNNGGVTASVSGLPVGTYAVWVSEQGNPACGAWGYYTVWGPTGPSSIKEKISNNEISVYPNPASENIYFRIKNTTTLNLTILDISGKILIKRSLSNKNNFIAVVELKEGVYLYQIKNSKEENFKNGIFSVVR